MLEGLKKLVFVQQPGADNAAAHPKAPAAAQVASAVTGTAPAGEVAVTAPAGEAAGSPVINVKGLEEHLEQAIHASPAFAPFAAFSKNAESMAVAIPDEAQRFKAAQAVAGIAPADLIAAVNSVSDVLSKEATDFEQSYVVAGQAEVTSLNQEIEQVTGQIGDLAKQLAVLNEKKASLAARVTTKTSDIAKAKIDFTAVSSTVAARYQEIAQKLKQYLGV
ncbi:hypothetical protein A9R05_43330 (plasmid) [Burkholderia sp. KK1]|uniref:hypothetical protein n=1 Tax=Burkholderia sp. M701 TaxID=326454 RepID=UPI0009798ED3|nr:hypothetical protein [Burkholderia sp. M701]AQH05840.1 hypothetical protein A9R05_43330 [Burkholderia sp. KK1]